MILDLVPSQFLIKYAYTDTKPVYKKLGNLHKNVNKIVQI
jgi:hypothetical protein